MAETREGYIYKGEAEELLDELSASQFKLFVLGGLLAHILAVWAP